MRHKKNTYRVSMERTEKGDHLGDPVVDVRIV